MWGAGPASGCPRFTCVNPQRKSRSRQLALESNKMKIRSLNTSKELVLLLGPKPVMTRADVFLGISGAPGTRVPRFLPGLLWLHKSAHESGGVWLRWPSGRSHPQHFTSPLTGPAGEHAPRARESKVSPPSSYCFLLWT